MLVYPGDASSAVQIPSNTAQAFLEVLATGAAEEVRSLSNSLAELELTIYYVQEFWYTNVLDEYREVYPDAGLIGKGPFREVQLRIDNLLGQYRLYHLTHSVRRPSFPGDLYGRRQSSFMAPCRWSTSFRYPIFLDRRHALSSNVSCLIE